MRARTLVVLFCALIVTIQAATITVFPTSPSVGNCYPFGVGSAVVLDDDDWAQFAGFVYQNVPAFELAVGDLIEFDLGNVNDFPISLNIDLSATTVNGGDVAVAFTRVVTDQEPASPLGNTVVGDFDLDFVAEAPFSFPGGGLIIRFSDVEPRASGDGGCEQVLVGTDNADASGFFVGRFYGDDDGSSPYVDDDGTSIGAFRIVTGAGATADPHLRGANGIEYDFSGKADGVYTLVSAPQFEVTMRLSASGPAQRFITQIGVIFRNQTIAISTGPLAIAEMHAKLQAAGGAAKRLAVNKVELQLCPGHAVIIEQVHYVNAKLVAAHAQRVGVDYLNVIVDAPGCHDSYDGALGQTYQCRFANGKEKFVWSHAQEETFRIASLFTTSGAFSPTAPCADFGTASPVSGSSRHALHDTSPGSI